MNIGVVVVGVVVVVVAVDVGITVDAVVGVVVIVAVGIVVVVSWVINIKHSLTYFLMIVFKSVFVFLRIHIINNSVFYRFGVEGTITISSII